MKFAVKVSFVIAACLAALLAPRPATATETLDTALRAREAGDLGSAEQLLLELRTSRPKDFSVHFELIVTRFWNEDFSGAQSALDVADVALTLEPHQLCALTEIRARVELAQERWRDALLALQGASGPCADVASFHAAWGTAERASFQPTEAKSHYQRSLALDSENEESRRGLEALQTASPWLVRATLRGGVTRTSADADPSAFEPGGELFIQHRFNPDHWVFGRLTQTLPRWGDPGGPESGTPDGLLTRGEAGWGTRPTRRLVLESSYLISSSSAPLHQALQLQASHRFSRLVALGSVRPGVDLEGRVDLLAQAGLQVLLPRGFWVMGQFFQYAASEVERRPGQSSSTLVGTLAHETATTSLRAGGGAGWYEAGNGFPLFARATLRVHPRWQVGVGYEGFVGFYQQHQLSLEAEVRF